MQGNQLTQIPRGLFGYAEDLVEVNLENNRIYAVYETFDRNPNLQKLLLRGNVLRSFDIPLPSTLTHLSLGGNVVTSEIRADTIEEANQCENANDSNGFTAEFLGTPTTCRLVVI